MTNEAEIEQHTTPRRSVSRIALFALVFSLAVAILGAMSGLGNRWGMWDFRTGFTLLRWAAYGGMAALVIALIAAIVTRPGSARRGFGMSAIALLIALIVVAIPWQNRRQAQGVPPIHDITTDTNDPPQFVSIAPLRADAPNPVTYEGEEIARQQLQAYPDIEPVLLDMPRDRAFQRALDAAESQGWEIVDAAANEGRIEATDRTFWFGFYDDVVIRLTEVNGRTVVDVRSKSRVGRSDLGVNAERIRDYLADVRG